MGAHPVQAMLPQGEQPAPNPPQRKWTLPELLTHKAPPSILIGLHGKVYDVTAAAHFYGPGSGYAIFAGCDATRGLATSSLDPSTVYEKPGETSDLTHEQMQTLAKWIVTFQKKYKCVGTIDRAPNSKL